MLKQNKKDKQDRHRWLLIGFLCLFGVCLVAQVRPTEQKTKATGTSTKSVADTSKTTKKQPENKKTKVYLLHADEGQADKLARPDVQVLIGNVKMRHDSMYMYCDSALILRKPIQLRLSVMYVWSREIRCSFTVIIFTMME